MTKKTQLAVIGAGPGGYAAAFYAADHGLEVTLIDRNPVLGGVCLNWGCIPSKFLLHLSRLAQEAEEAAAMGFHFGKPQIDLDQVRQYKSKVIGTLNRGLASLAKARKVEVLEGQAKFLEPHKLVIEGKDTRTELEFDHAVIAVGSRSVIPGILKGISPRIMDSDGALELKEIPGKLLVVGGGIIGLELGSVYSALGSAVSVVEILPQIATGVDRDLVKPLERRLKKKFKKIHTSTRVLSAKEGGGELKVEFQRGEEKFSETYHSLLVATGRIPNTDHLALEKIGIQKDEKGLLPIGPALETSQPHIFAIGDIVEGPMLAHKSSRQGKVAVEKILNPKTLWDQKGIPAVIYTDPEIAWVGLTEEEAKAQGIPYKLGQFPWKASGRALAIGRPEGLTKILFHPETERVLGVGIVGPGAGELIGEGCLALEMGAVAEDLGSTIHPHPTLSETLLESAEDFFGLSTHLFQPKK